jgi:hypothetical protein
MRRYNFLDSLRSDIIDLRLNVLEKINKECIIEHLSYRLELYPHYYIRLVYKCGDINYRKGFICYRRDYNYFKQEYDSLKIILNLMNKHRIDKIFFNKYDTVIVERGHKWHFGNKVSYDPKESRFYNYVNEKTIKIIK